MQKINLETGRQKQGESVANDPNAPDPYGNEIDKAQRLLEELKEKKAEQEREEAYQREIKTRRQNFDELRGEVIEKLTEALPRIDQELFGAKQEITDLEQAKQHFSTHLKSIEDIDTHQWTDEQVMEQSDKFQNYLAKTAKEYDQFNDILAEGRNGGGQELRVSKAKASSTFSQDVMRGFAFTLPLIVALVILFSIFGG